MRLKVKSVFSFCRRNRLCEWDHRSTSDEWKWSSCATARGKINETTDKTAAFRGPLVERFRRSRHNTRHTWRAWPAINHFLRCVLGRSHYCIHSVPHVDSDRGDTAYGRSYLTTLRITDGKPIGSRLRTTDTKSTTARFMLLTSAKYAGLRPLSSYTFSKSQHYCV